MSKIEKKRKKLEERMAKSTDELREAVIKKFDSRAVRLQDELEAMLSAARDGR